MATARKSTPTEAATLELEGKKAPDFKLTDRTGKTVALKDLTSHGAVVLYFYPKDMTPGCTTEACSFRDNSAAIRKLGARAYGVYKKKSLYGREYMGIERSTFIIDSKGKIARVFPKVKVAGHTEDVLAALKALK